MTKNYLLKGSKGGGGGGSTPTRTPDNLRSKDTVECVLALSEGPIFGLEEGAKSFLIGDTPLQNQNGEYNFKTFALNFFPGTDVADPIVPILGGQSTNTQVSVVLATNTPVVRTTNLIGNVDYIEVRLAFQRLLVQNDRGSFNADASFRIEYKASSSSTWIKAYNQDIALSGKTTSTYVKEFRIPVDRINSSYDIRVTKLSPANTETYFCDMAWESFQEVTVVPKAYNNTALIQVSGEASDQFSSTPQWAGIYKGLIVKVPTNYDPELRTYTDIWDGTWKLAYTDNPAWCLYDFIMNDRYGIRSYYIDVNIDKYDIYDAAVWCDELVPDGKGGYQPRYTFNTIITEATPGKELARYIAGVFNATFFDDLNGKAFLRVDRDDPAAHIFMKENVSDEGFQYSYTDLTSRYNDITVTFINPDLEWNQDRRRIYDQSKIDMYGRIPLDFIAVGCINEHEAKRRAQYKLITSNTETCIVSFTTNRLGSIVSPFDVILVCDPDMGYGVSGRIKSISSDRKTIYLRTPIYLEVGVQYDCTFTLNDGTKVTANIHNIEPGYNTELNFAGALPSNLADRATFSLSADGVIGLPRPFRVTKIEELDGSADGYKIEAVNINRNKWYDSDNLTDSGTIDYSALPSPTNPPGPISCSFTERYVKAKKQFELIVSPTFNRGAYKYYSNDHSFEVWSRPTGTIEPYVKREIVLGDTVVDHPPGLYDFKILGKSYLGFTTDINSADVYTFELTNPKDPPKDVDWARINSSEVYWGYANPPDDFAGFIVRYHNQVGRTTWDDAIQPHQGILTATSFYTSLIPPSARVIMVRAVDDFGIVSLNSATILRELGDVTVSNIVDTVAFHPTFIGTKTGCSVVSGRLEANDTGTKVYSGTPTAYMYNGGNFYEGVYEEMVYEASFSLVQKGNMVVNIDFDGDGYQILMRNQGDTIWNPVPTRAAVSAGDYELQITVFGGPVRGVIRTLELIVDADSIEEDIQDFEVSASGSRLPLTKNFGTIRLVSVIIQDDGTHDQLTTAVGYRIFDKDPVNGPLVKLVDASGSYVPGLIDAVIKGY